MSDKCLLICVLIEFESTIYGLYFFAGGGEVDQGQSEVVDKNDDYSAA